MLSLAVDIGNSRIKTGVFRNKELVSAAAYSSLLPQTLEDIYKSFEGITHTMISSVAGDFTDLVTAASAHSIVLKLSDKLTLPVNIRYDGTPGNDRVAAASAVSFINPQGNSLVIDCGTCITYTLVLTGNLFTGGAISPGIETRYKSLHTFTANLPLLKFDNDFHHITGSSTTGSIHSGVLNGALSEVKGMIQMYEKEYPGLKVYLTGGFSGFFEKGIKNGIFADPHLVLKGLNNILHLNVSS